MKKNAMLKIAAILMVAVLLTTCAISSTFAKYASNFNSTATARVAKWGVGAATTLELFATEYGTAQDTPDNVEAVVASGSSLGFDGIVAPGTTGLAEVTSVLSGTPEVSVKVNYTIDIEYTNFISGYDPIKWSLNGTDWFDAATFETKVAELTFDEIAAGTDLSSATNIGLDIHWKWDFESDGANASANDVNDTAMGNKTGNEVPAISVVLTTNIIQSGAAGAPYVASAPQG